MPNAYRAPHVSPGTFNRLLAEVDKKMYAHVSIVPSDATDRKIDFHAYVSRAMFAEFTRRLWATFDRPSPDEDRPVLSVSVKHPTLKCYSGAPLAGDESLHIWGIK